MMKPKTAIITGTVFATSFYLFSVFGPANGTLWGRMFLYSILSGAISFLTMNWCWSGLEENRMQYLRANVRDRQKFYDKLMNEMKDCRCYDLAYKNMYSIMKKRPHQRLHRYPPFRAWYKDWVDRVGALAYYSIKIHSPERDIDYDEFYDPSAPPMSQYFKDDDEMVCSWDDELDDYGDPKPLTREDLEDAVEDALEDYGRKHKRNSVGDGLAIGIGIGIGNSLTGGHGLGSGS